MFCTRVSPTNCREHPQHWHDTQHTKRGRHGRQLCAPSLRPEHCRQLAIGVLAQGSCASTVPCRRRTDTFLLLGSLAPDTPTTSNRTSLETRSFQVECREDEEDPIEIENTQNIQRARIALDAQPFAVLALDRLDTSHPRHETPGSCETECCNLGIDRNGSLQCLVVTTPHKTQNLDIAYNHIASRRTPAIAIHTPDPRANSCLRMAPWPHKMISVLLSHQKREAHQGMSSIVSLMQLAGL